MKLNKLSPMYPILGVYTKVCFVCIQVSGKQILEYLKSETYVNAR